jgi:hypothetical protein
MTAGERPAWPFAALLPAFRRRGIAGKEREKGKVLAA